MEVSADHQLLAQSYQHYFPLNQKCIYSVIGLFVGSSKRCLAIGAIIEYILTVFTTFFNIYNILKSLAKKGNLYLEYTNLFNLYKELQSLVNFF